MKLKQLSLLLGISCCLFGTRPASALMLGGVNVPKDKIVVYILIGHSNMAGIDLGKADGTTNPMCWNYPVKTKQWVLAKEPPNQKAAGLSGNGEAGPGMPFLKQLAAAYPGYYIGVVTNASLSATCRGLNTGNNSSGLDPGDNRYWKDSVTGPSYLYDQIVGAAKAIQNDVTLGGILCMLGTVDATRTSEATCQAFSDDITTLVKNMRADLGMPNLPYIMGEYENGASGQFALTQAWPAIVAAQIKLIPSKLSMSATVNSVGIPMLDDHHYTGDVGEPEFAKRVIAVIQSNKWFPNGTSSDMPVLRANARNEKGPMLLPESGAETIDAKTGFYLINGAAARPALIISPRP